MSGERNRALRKPAPRIRPRTMASAAMVPTTVAIATVRAASWRLRLKASMKSREPKNFPNHRREKPDGGNTMKAAELTAKRSTMAMGRRRKATRAATRPRKRRRSQAGRRILHPHPARDPGYRPVVREHDGQRHQQQDQAQRPREAEVEHA